MRRRKPIRISRATYRRVVICLVFVVCLIVWFSHRRWQIYPERLGTASWIQRIASSGIREDDPARKSSASHSDKQSHCVPDHLELPACPDQEFLLENHAGRYTLWYDTSGRQAAWVAYLLTRADVRRHGAERRNAFRSDPEVVARGWATAVDRDYRGSGYDRGHLLPSADRDDTQSENNATFLLWNISPQCPALNLVVWKRLEEQVREWADRYDSLYVVTGGVREEGLTRIGGGVSVPRRFFKAIMVRDGSGYQAIGFVIPNDSQVASDYMRYVTTVDRIEEATGFDLYVSLPDTLEVITEGRVDRSFWH